MEISNKFVKVFFCESLNCLYICGFLDKTSKNTPLSLFSQFTVGNLEFCRIPIEKCIFALKCVSRQICDGQVGGI